MTPLAAFLRVSDSLLVASPRTTAAAVVSPWFRGERYMQASCAWVGGCAVVLMLMAYLWGRR